MSSAQPALVWLSALTHARHARCFRWALLIAVLADEQTDFAGFLAFYERFPTSRGLMCWQILDQGGQLVVNPDGGSGCATDGDMDAAYALLLAGDSAAAADCLPVETPTLTESLQGGVGHSQS